MEGKGRIFILFLVLKMVGKGGEACDLRLSIIFIMDYPTMDGGMEVFFSS
jgi:hypothetical protein